MSTVTRYLVLAMRRPDFDEAVIEPHKAFLDDLRARGMLEMTGGFGDGSGGAYLLRNVASLEAARAIVAADPLALQQTSNLIVHEWHTR
ncbi:hypothetical protein BEN78_16710 [Xanthomonas citri pv. mangiferaeindicae]|nr:hypothetical protein BEN78_16710 [Xanthomonas citri pv. mangiferaeindicae]